jgi:hypothetical protein
MLFNLFRILYPAKRHEAQSKYSMVQTTNLPFASNPEKPGCYSKNTKFIVPIFLYNIGTAITINLHVSAMID